MVRARFQLLLVLLPLAAWWWWLAIHAPIFGWNNFNSFDDGKRFSLRHTPGNSTDGYVFDVEKREARRVNNPVDLESSHSGFGLRASILSRAGQRMTVQLELWSYSQPGSVRLIVRDFLALSNFRIVAGRFVVVDGGGAIQWLDAEDPQEIWHSQANQPGQSAWLWTHARLPVFRRTATKPLPATSTQPPQRFTELYRFDQHGQLTLLGSWLNANSGTDGPGEAWFQGETLATCDVSGRFIELRSVVDGQLVEQLELNPPVDLATQTFRIDDDLLVIQKADLRRCYCIRGKRWLKSPWEERDEWTRSSLVLSPESRYALWFDSAKGVAVISDPNSDSQVCELRTIGERYKFLMRAR